jgi:RNA polymerase sigma-70 factor (ECF subfamily)
MSRKITLTESELVKLVQKIISEQSSSDLDELELVQLMKNGDQRAQTEFFKRFYKQMFGFVRSKSQKFDDSDIDAIVTRALGRAITGINQFRGESNLESWVRTIVRNTMIDLVKRNSTNKAKAFKYVDPDDFLHSNRYQETNPINDVQKIFNLFLKTLKEKERNIMVLRAQGDSVKEISDKLDINDGTVKWYISGLMKRFKEFMEKNK